MICYRIFFLDKLNKNREFLPRPIWELFICYPDKSETYDGDFDLNNLLTNVEL